MIVVTKSSLTLSLSCLSINITITIVLFNPHCRKTVEKFIQFVFKSTHLPCWFSRHTHCKKISTKVYKFFKHQCMNFRD